MIFYPRMIRVIAGVLFATFTLYMLRILDVSLSERRHQLNIYNTSAGWIQQNVALTCINTTTHPAFYVCPYNETRDKYISRALLSSGVWEPVMTRLFQAALQLYPNATVLDIGANIGYYSLLAAGMGHHVIAVEPVKENVIRLSRAAYLARLDERMIIMENAVSAGGGDVAMSSSADNQGGLRVLGRADIAGPGPIVRAVTLDDVTAYVHTDHVVVKVDIEGHECKALEKSGGLFARFIVPYIFMEWQRLFALQHLTTSTCPPPAVRTLAASLARAGYTAHDMKFGIQLDPATANRWRSDDVYWRHSTAPILTHITRRDWGT